MPFIAYGQPAWVDDVLEAVERQVAAGSGLPRDKVFSYAGEPDDLLKFPSAERFVSCWVLDMPADLRIVAGGGAAHSAWDGRVRADVCCRLATDKQLTDTRLLRDRSFGYGRLVRQVAKALQMFDANDGSSSIFREPCRVVRVNWNPRRPPAGWAWARVEARALFRTDLTV